jgi:hypothetical protein
VNQTSKTFLFFRFTHPLRRHHRNETKPTPNTPAQRALAIEVLELVVSDSGQGDVLSDIYENLCLVNARRTMGKQDRDFGKQHFNC